MHYTYKTIKLTLLFLTILAFSLHSSENSPFKIIPSGHTFTVDWHGRQLISGEAFSPGFGQDHIHEEPGIWNRWGIAQDLPYRREIGYRNQGREIEFTFQTNIPAYYHTRGAKTFHLKLPWKNLKGMKYQALIGRTDSIRPVNGMLDDKTPKGDFIGSGVRQLMLQKDGRSLVLDFNVDGVNDFYSDYIMGCRTGRWTILRKADELICSIRIPCWTEGGSMSAKLIIYEGDESDYLKRHAHKSYDYYSGLEADSCYVFGAEKFGKMYKDAGTKKYTRKNGFGWKGSSSLTVEHHRPQGALYSAVSGRKPAVFQMDNLRSGVHILTFSTGTGDRKCGPFSIECNGQPIAKNITIPARTVKVISIPIWLENSTAAIRFAGHWRISTISDQVLMGSAEDVSFRRGFWLSDIGHYPSPMFNNEHYKTPPKFKVSISDYPLPEPGQECNGPHKELKNDSLHAVFAPGKDWRVNFELGTLGTDNASTFTEYTTPSEIQSRIESLKKNHFNALLINGLLPRHTYPAHLPRVRKVITDTVKAAKKANIVCMDHIDGPMLWNSDSGFRVLTETTDQLQCTINGHMPARGRCIVNPKANEPYYEELLEHVRTTGLDGLMIDELCYLDKHFCGCAACRKKFKADTGWELPADELSPHLYNRDSRLWRLWLSWRRHQVGEFWMGLRRKIAAYKKDFVFIGYTTHYGLWGDWASNDLAQDIIQASRAWDLTGTEIMTRNIFYCYRSIQSLRLAMDMFKAVYNVPSFGLVYAYEWDLKYFGWALNNMTAQATWEIHSMKCPEGKRNYHTFSLPQGNMNRLEAQSAARIALLFSVNSRDCNQGSPYDGELFGTSQFLNSRHINHDIISEVGLKPEILKRYKVLILGNSPSMSDKDIATVKEFARQGGTVMLSYMTGRYDELCAERKDYPFSDILGIRQSWNSSVYTVGEVGSSPDRLSLQADGKIYVRTVRYDKDAAPEKLLYFRDKDYKHVIRPLLISAPCGKGKFLYTPALIGPTLQANETAVHRKFNFRLLPGCDAIMEQVMQNATKGKDIWIPEQIPDKVLTRVYHIPEGMCLHFLNATGADFPTGQKLVPDMPKNPFPALENDIIFQLPEVKSAQAYAVSPDFDGKKMLTVEKNQDQGIRVVLPRHLLKTYTLVYIKK